MELVRHLKGRLRPESPLVTVCIAHYKGINLLKDCIESILVQNCRFEVEIIVHDDACDAQCLDFLQNNYPKVDILASRSNVGFCIANNRMVDRSRGKYILLLNNDAALFPDALQLLYDSSIYRAESLLTLPQYDWVSGDLVDRGCLLDIFYNPTPNLDPSRDDVAMCIGACLWLTKYHWQQLGGFPEWMGSIGEDLFLCCRARLSGLSVQVLNHSGYFHRQGQSFGGNKPDEKGRLHSTIRRRKLSETNKLATLIVCTPTLLVWPLAALAIVGLIAEGVIISVLRMNHKILTGIYLGSVTNTMQNVSALLIARKEIQSARAVSLRKFLMHFTWFPRKLRLVFKYGLPKVSP